MNIPKRLYPLLAVQTLGVIGFTINFLYQKNYEFIFYIAVIVFFFALVVKTLNKTKFSDMTLWGLVLWSFLHMGGGGLFFGGTKFYEIILIPISESYSIFKYDQFAHLVGFAVGTMVMWELLKPKLKEPIQHWITLSIIVVMAGCGLGALNEVIEFSATLFVENHGVGGYVNTALDLCFNMAGAILAMIWIVFREKKGNKS